MASVAELVLSLQGKDRASGQIGKVRGSLDKLNGGLKTAGKVGAIGAAGIAAVGAAAVGGAFKVAGAADSIDKMSSRLGVGTTALQEMQHWADQNGVSQQTLEKSVGRLNQRIGDAAVGNGKYAQAFEDLGVSVKDSNGNIRDTEDVMQDTVAQLRNIEDPALRAAKAQEIFGTKTARDLLPALEDGSLSLKEAAAAAHENNQVMSEDAIAAGVKFTDSWDNIKKTVTGALQQALIPVMTFMADHVFPFIQDRLIPAFRKFADWAGPKLQSGLQSGREAIENLVEKGQDLLSWAKDNILPALQDLGGVVKDDLLPPLEDFANWFKNNESAMQALGVAVGAVLVGAFAAWAVSAGAAAVATIAAAAPVIALVAVVAGLAAGVFLLIKHWDSITEKMPILGTAVDAVKSAFDAFSGWLTGTFFPVILDIAETVKEAGQKAIGFVEKHWGTIQGVIDGVMEAISGLIEGWWTTIEGIIGGALSVIEGIIDTVMGVITGDWDRAWEGIKGIVTGVWEGIEGIIDGFLTTIEGLINGVLTAIDTDWREIWTGIKTFLEGIASFFTDTVPGWIGDMKDDAVGFVTDLKDDTIELFGNLVTGVMGAALTFITETVPGWAKDMWDKVTGWVSDLASDTVSSISGLVTDVTTTAKTFITETVPGWFGDLKDDATGFVSDMASEAWQSAKDLKTNLTDTLKTFIKDTVPGWFKSGMNGLIGFMESGINAPIDGFNDLVSGIASLIDSVAGWIPGLSIPTNFTMIPSVSLPRMAKGGISAGGLTLVGEEGPELANLPRGTEISPARDTSKLLSGLAEAERQGVAIGGLGDIKDAGADLIGGVADVTGISRVWEGLKTAGDFFQGAVEASLGAVNKLLEMGVRKVINTGYANIVEPLLDKLPDGFVGDLAKGAAAHVKDAAIELIGGAAEAYSELANVWTRPAAGGVTQEFGFTPFSSAYSDGRHKGIDLAAAMGSDILAANSGIIQSAGWESSGFGIAIRQKLNNGLTAIYGHLQRALVSAGDAVTSGQRIGLADSTGFSTGSHLHFELRAGGMPINPRSVMPFADGGIARSPMVGMVGEGGPEAVIPLSKLQKDDRPRRLRDRMRRNEGNGVTVNLNGPVTINARDKDDARRSVGDMAFALRARGAV